jgi:hypothetical protein
MLDQSNVSVQRCRLIFWVESSVGGYFALAKTIINNYVLCNMSFLFCKFLQRAAKWFTNLSKKRFVDFAHRRSLRSARHWPAIFILSVNRRTPTGSLFIFFCMLPSRHRLYKSKTRNFIKSFDPIYNVPSAFNPLSCAASSSTPTSSKG